MRRAFIAVNVALLWALAAAWFFTPLRAGVSCSVPFQLTNGTLADASQVMANYNAILNCLANNTAASGANSDITSLSALSTPLSPAQGGSSTYIGSTSVGTNTITVATTTPTNYLPVAGTRVVFVAGGTNTGAVTLAVASTAARPIFRSGGNALAGGEIISGGETEVIYDGTNYWLATAPIISMFPGTVFDYAGTTCPLGSLNADGSNQLTANYPTLAFYLGTTWGAPGGGQFTLPDLRGRATFGLDSTGARITVAGGNFNGNAVGASGGQQNYTLTAGASGNLPPITPSGSVALNPTPANNGVVFSVSTSGPNTTTGGGATVNYAGVFAPTFSGNNFGATSLGTQTPVPVLSNAAIVLKCIKT